MIKITPEKDISEFGEPVEKQIEKFLRDNPTKAYHTTLIMVRFFGVKQNEIGGSFVNWKNQEDVALWRKVRNALHSLHDQGKLEMRREGKINWFWWSNHK